MSSLDPQEEIRLLQEANVTLRNELSNIQQEKLNLISDLERCNIENQDNQNLISQLRDNIRILESRITSTTPPITTTTTSCVGIVSSTTEDTLYSSEYYRALADIMGYENK